MLSMMGVGCVTVTVLYFCFIKDLTEDPCPKESQIMLAVTRRDTSDHYQAFSTPPPPPQTPGSKVRFKVLALTIGSPFAGLCTVGLALQVVLLMM